MNGSLGSTRRWCPNARSSSYGARRCARARDVLDDDIRRFAATAAAPAVDAALFIIPLPLCSAKASRKTIILRNTVIIVIIIVVAGLSTPHTAHEMRRMR